MCSTNTRCNSAFRLGDGRPCFCCCSDAHPVPCLHSEPTSQSFWSWHQSNTGRLHIVGDPATPLVADSSPDQRSACSRRRKLVRHRPGCWADVWGLWVRSTNTRCNSAFLLGDGRSCFCCCSDAHPVPCLHSEQTSQSIFGLVINQTSIVKTLAGTLRRRSLLIPVRISAPLVAVVEN